MAVPVNVIAQTDDTKEDSAAAIYAKTFNVTLEVAQERLAIQFEIGDLTSKIEAVEPSYAGAWIIHEPDYGLFVGFTVANGEEILQKYLAGIKWATLVKAQQMPHTVSEFLEIQSKIDSTRTDITTAFASATDFQKGKIVLSTPALEALRLELENQASLQPYLDDIELVQQAEMAAPGILKYPYLLGGTALNGCTAGFVVKRVSDQRRFIATAGHCPNAQYLQNATGIYFGTVVAGTENNPIHPPPYWSRSW